MRYGIVREAETLPPAELQKLLLEAYNCHELIEESSVGDAAAKRLERLIMMMKPDDELVLPGLEVFLLTTGEIALVLQDMLEAGASVILAISPSKSIALRAGDTAATVIALLAEHERRRPSFPVPESRPRSAGGSRNPLSRFQKEYARKVYAQGMPLRSIGMLFQVSPDVIWKVVGGFLAPWLYAAATMSEAAQTLPIV